MEDDSQFDINAFERALYAMEGVLIHREHWCLAHNGPLNEEKPRALALKMPLSLGAEGDFQCFGLVICEECRPKDIKGLRTIYDNVLEALREEMNHEEIDIS